MTEVLPPINRPSIMSVSRAEVIAALNDHVNKLFEIEDGYPKYSLTPNSPLSTWRIFDSLERFAREPLPTGINETQFRFLATIALLDLGEQVAQRDFGMLMSILDYYTSERRLDDIGRERFGGMTGTRVGQLKNEGLRMLFSAMPNRAPDDFPFSFDKEQDFPETAFQQTGRIRAANAMLRARRGNTMD